LARDEFPSENQRRLGYLKPEIGKFPVFSRGTGNPPGGDRFADDCLHRHVYDLPECPPVMLDEAPEGGLGVWILVDSDDKTCTFEYGGGIA